ncbi:MAG: GNAT family N-acetyltransferase [Pseudomonadota bacterium]|nr:GNAT family N-acetyltransferase [Pseudomonadota bacterium]
MLTAETVRPQDLTAKDCAAWSALRGSAEAFQNPLLSPEFAEAVAKVRPDVAVAVIRRDGKAVGFLAHHRRPGGLARPIGAPFSDYHGLVAEPGLDGVQALRLAGLREYRFTALVDPHGAFGAAEQSADDAYAIAIGAGDTAGVDHMEALRAASPKRFKNVRRLDHKLEREVGPVELVAPDQDRATFETMFAWKREQFARTGLTDVFAPAWTRQLMTNLLQTREGRLRGMMITLQVAGKPVVMHFGVREGERFHPWIAAQDEALAAYSPGQIFLWRAVEAMPSLGLRWYDLAAGHDHYKTPYASRTVPIAEGQVRTAPGMEAEVWRLAETALGVGGVARVRRRLDQIASVELTLNGRLRGLAQAVATRAKREAARPASHHIQAEG